MAARASADGTVRSRLRLASPVAALVGIVVVVIGTFLPWLRSGRATRNSYEATGIVRRLIHPPGILDDLYRVWPLLGAACALAVATYLVGLRPIGLLLGAVAAVAAGGAALAALNARANAYASVIDSGPAVTLAGAAIVLVSVAANLALRPGGRAREEPT